MTGRYGLVIMRAIRLAGVATVLALGIVHRHHGAARATPRRGAHRATPRTLAITRATP